MHIGYIKLHMHSTRFPLWCDAALSSDSRRRNSPTRRRSSKWRRREKGGDKG